MHADVWDCIKDVRVNGGRDLNLLEWLVVIRKTLKDVTKEIHHFGLVDCEPASQFELGRHIGDIEQVRVGCIVLNENLIILGGSLTCSR